MDKSSFRAMANKIIYLDMGFSAIVIMMSIGYSLFFTGAALAVLEPNVFGGPMKCTAGQPIASKTKDIKDALWNTWIITGIAVFSALLHLWAARKVLSATEMGKDAADISKLTKEYIFYASFANLACVMLVCGFGFVSYIWLFVFVLWVLGYGLFIHIGSKILPEQPKKLNPIPAPIPV